MKIRRQRARQRYAAADAEYWWRLKRLATPDCRGRSAPRRVTSGLHVTPD
jgi:hypothetical protein